MLKNRLKKGDRGYLNFRKKQVLIQTLILFGTSLLIFICGYLYKGTKANAMTIVAVLGLLPASKSLVSLIMYLKTPKYSETDYLEIKDAVENNSGLFDLYFTSYQKNYPVNSIICKRDLIIGYSEFENIDLKSLEEHLNSILKQNGHKDITIKIFKDSKKYKDRAEQITNQENSEILNQLMKDICL